MKRLITICILASIAFAGRFGIGISAGGEYQQQYASLTPENINDYFYSARGHLQAEALPNVYIEPSITYLNNPAINRSALGAGLGLNIQPRLGRFPIAPNFGAEGALLFYNDDPVYQAIRGGYLEQYLAESDPKFIATAYAGLSLFLGKGASLDCQYRYHNLAPQLGVQTIWGGLSFYVNW